MGRKNSLLTATILLAIVIGGFLVHLKLFSQTPYVNGTDGGFYAYKVREIVEEGRFSFSFGSPPVIFLTSALFAKFFGIFKGVKIATTLYSVLLGISIFILTSYIAKSRRAGLVAAFFAVFSPMSLRIAADIRKTSAVLFFIPLIVYFLLKLLENLEAAESLVPRSLKGAIDAWKYVIPLAIAGALGVLSHTSVITIWFALLAYFAFSLGIGRRTTKKEFIPFLVANIAILALMVFFYDKLGADLETVSAPPFPVVEPQFQELGSFILPLLIVAVPGVLLAIKRRNRQDIFLLAWFFLSFLLTFSQVVGPSEFWRFISLMFVPTVIFVGYSSEWLLSRLRFAGAAILLATAVLVVSQFLDFGRMNPQMMAQPTESILKSMEAAAEKIERNSYVYANFEYHTYLWLRYFFGVNTRRYTSGSLEEINDLIEEGRDVYLARALSTDMPPEGDKKDGAPATNKVVLGEEGISLEEEYTETVYSDGITEVLKLTTVVEASNANEIITPVSDEGSGSEMRGEYDFRRLKYLSTYLILPYEMINLINPPYIALWQIELGLPLSVMLIGFVFSLLIKASRLDPSKKMGIIAEALAIAGGAAIIFFLYGTSPTIFWGAEQDDTMNGKNSPDNDQNLMNTVQPGSGKDPCGDGICDQAEQKDPNLCPKDCL